MASSSSMAAPINSSVGASAALGGPTSQTSISSVASVSATALASAQPFVATSSPVSEALVSAAVASAAAASSSPPPILERNEIETIKHLLYFGQTKEEELLKYLSTLPEERQTLIRQVEKRLIEKGFKEKTWATERQINQAFDDLFGTSTVSAVFFSTPASSLESSSSSSSPPPILERNEIETIKHLLYFGQTKEEELLKFLSTLPEERQALIRQVEKRLIEKGFKEKTWATDSQINQAFAELFDRSIAS